MIQRKEEHVQAGDSMEGQKQGGSLELAFAKDTVY